MYNKQILLDCAKELSERLDLPLPEKHILLEKIDELLEGRENYLALQNNLITTNECANLLLGHFQTLICNNSSAEEPQKHPVSQSLIKKVEFALLNKT